MTKAGLMALTMFVAGQKEFTCLVMHADTCNETQVQELIWSSRGDDVLDSILFGCSDMPTESGR
jgi:hypothetical protein